MWRFYMVKFLLEGSFIKIVSAGIFSFNDYIRRRRILKVYGYVNYVIFGNNVYFYAEGLVEST